MSEPQKEPGWAFWTAAALVVLLAYPLSFGPACRVVSWTVSRDDHPLVTLYRPLVRAMQYPGWEWPRTVATWYGGETGRSVWLIVRMSDAFNDL